MGLFLLIIGMGLEQRQRIDQTLTKNSEKHNNQGESYG
jgi:hypothetical protein